LCIGSATTKAAGYQKVGFSAALIGHPAKLTRIALLVEVTLSE
jgi:hypothetical protein